jgi:hypothetical protein
MRGFLLRESHRLVATFHHLAVMGALALLGFPLLGWERNTNIRNYQQRNCYPDQYRTFLPQRRSRIDPPTRMYFPKGLNSIL